MYQETASYGHVGRTPQVVTKQFKNADGSLITKEVELFTWEKTDYVAAIKGAFGL
jgi:S-adenosylmethionine synthetase